MSRIRSINNYDCKIAGLYDLGDTLGRGHFAVVKLAKHVFTGEQVAVKVIDKTKLDDVSRAHLFQEVRCMKLVQHPNVVRLYEVIDTQTKLYLILELGDGGDMYDYIMKHEKGVNEETAKKYFRQIVQAISYCHKLHVVHRDLKPENVVFFEKLGMVKLTDFGFSNKFCPGQKLETSCGSLAYSAPEILLGDSYDAPKVDVWSLGVILYMMVCGHAPFQEANDSETLTMIMDCKYTVPSYISPSCHFLIQRMLIRNPEKRATLEDISKDAWLNSGDTIHPAECLPLISRESLLEEDHTHIIQKMVNGNIASKEDIVEALDKNEYNHITATYYLLAERKLRAQRHEKAQLMQHNRISRADLSPVAVTPGISSASPSPAQEKPATPVDSLLSPCVTLKTMESKQYGAQLALPPTITHSAQLAPSPTCTGTQDAQPAAPTIGAMPPSTLEIPNACLPLGRKCSIVREEEDSLTSANSSPTKSPSQEMALADKLQRKPSVTVDDSVIRTSDIQVAIPSFKANCYLRPLMSLPVVSDTSLNLKSKGEKIDSVKGGASSKLKVLPSSGRRLHTVQSSPQLLLNEIDEETEHESDAGSHRSGHKKTCYLGKIHSHNSAVSHAMLRIMGQRHKFNKNRTASCSSSDASDDDSESLKRIMGKLKTPGRRDRDRKPDRGGNGGGAPGGGGSGSSTGGGSGHNPGGSSSGPNDRGSGNQFGKNNSPCSGSPRDGVETDRCLKNAHLGTIVFPTDSTDSLDLIAEPQPRLVTSVSCGDLASEALPVIEVNSISAENLHDETMVAPPPVKPVEKEVPPDLPAETSLTAKLRNKLSNSLSLSSGLSCLQNTANISSDSLTQNQKKETPRINIVKLVQKSPVKQKQQLDINQNGWKKGGSNQRSAVEMKMASKCCTLC